MIECKRCGASKDDELFPTRTRNGRVYQEHVCKGCQAKRQRERHDADIGRARDNHNAAVRRRRKRNPAREMLNRVRHRCASTGMPFSITEADLGPLPAVCPVLGIPINYTATKEERESAASIDRIQNELGYVPGNVIVVSLRANLLKRDATPEELRKLAKFYTKLERFTSTERERPS